MKKLAFVLFGVLLGVIASHLMKPNEVSQVLKEKKEMVKPEPVLSTEKEIPDPPKGLISPERAQVLSDNYSPRHTIIDKALHIEDNRSVWFSIENLEKYIKYAKYESDQILKTENSMNGIRIYLGAYPKKGEVSEKANLTTVFLVPTYDNSISKGSMIPVPISLSSANVPGGSPLNEGALGEPPGSAYPN